MFSARQPVSPSPTRTSIKEANGHLLLLHTKVAELEKTVKEQADCLIKKDELMYAKIDEVSALKDVEIKELLKKLESCEGQITQLEHSCKEKDAQIETLSQRCVQSEEVVSFVPVIEKLLTSMKKLSVSGKTACQTVCNNRPKSRVNRFHKPDRRMAGNYENSLMNFQHNSDSSDAVEGHLGISKHNQALTDIKIGRSFKINRNFSISEDEGDSGEML